MQWDGDAGNYSYGGYYNCTSCNPQAVTFGGSTNSKSAVVNCVAVPLSVHFSVTANCADGSHGYSPQVFITF